MSQWYYSLDVKFEMKAQSLHFAQCFESAFRNWIDVYEWKSSIEPVLDALRSGRLHLSINEFTLKSKEDNRTEIQRIAEKLAMSFPETGFRILYRIDNEDMDENYYFSRVYSQEEGLGDIAYPSGMDMLCTNDNCTKRLYGFAYITDVEEAESTMVCPYCGKTSSFSPQRLQWLADILKGNDPWGS